MINFLRYRKFSLVFTIILLGLGVFFFVKRQGFVYGIDFTGGSEVRLAFNSPTDISMLRNHLDASDKWSEVVLQGVSGTNDFVMRVQESGDSLEDDLREVLDQKFAEKYDVSSIERIGPEAGKEVSYNAMIAILWTLFILAIYIALRQRYAYALGAIAALAHDVFVILVFYLVTGEAMSLSVLMGVLAVLGYSLNDTIIVFSRINSNLGLLKKMGADEVVNLSLNQTLSRTILTSLSTLIAVLMLYFFGGIALKSFSVTMILGVVFGTYSSIYIASPVMLYFNNQFAENNSIFDTNKRAFKN